MTFYLNVQFSSGDQNVFYTKYNPAYYFGTSSVTEAMGRCAAQPSIYNESYPAIDAQCRVEPWMTAAMPQGDSDEAVILQKYKDFLKNADAKVILSNSDKEYQDNLHEILQQADKLGVAKLEDYMTKKVPEMKKLYQN